MLACSAFILGIGFDCTACRAPCQPRTATSELIAFPRVLKCLYSLVLATEAKNTSKHSVPCPWLTPGLEDAGALGSTGAGLGPVGLWKRSQSLGHVVETTP